VVDAQAAQLGGDRLAIGALGGGEALAQAAAVRVDLDPLAGFGVDQGQPPDGGQRALARVADLDGEHRVAHPQRAHRGLPAALAAEVGDDDDEPGLAGDAPDAAQGVGERVRVLVAVGGDPVGQCAAQADEPWPAAARGQQARLGRAEREQRDAPGAADGQPADDERHALGDVRLEPLGGAEGHRRRHVDDEPRRQRALGDVHAHVRDAGARRRRRVDLAHVVADLVGAQLRELGAGADAGRAPVTGQQPGRAAGDDEIERLDQRRGHRARSLPAVRDTESRGRRHAAAARRRRWSEGGISTVEITRSMMSSALMPSLRAS
jgi:hypothetical protein